MAITDKSKVIVYWVATTISAIAFILPGIGNLIHLPHIADDMAHLGYPTYFLSILGTWKILGAITILIPNFKRLKEWAYAGMIFDLTGASISRICVGDKILMSIIPLVLATFVMLSWKLRPTERKI